MALKGTGIRSLCCRATHRWSSSCSRFGVATRSAWSIAHIECMPAVRTAQYGQTHVNLPATLRVPSAFFSTHQTRREARRQELATQDDDPFDSLTDKIPQKPVTFVEGASYSIAIFAGFAVAAVAAYGVFKELIFEPKEYKVFNQALARVQNDNQITVRIGSPITGYGQESRNRAARQHIPHRVWVDEDGVERIEVQFHIRGPRGAGKVYAEMFKVKKDKKWKFTYLIVDIVSPSPTRLMLESYVPE